MPYRGSTQAHPDLIANRVNIMFDTVPAALPHIQSGALKALATTGAQLDQGGPGLMFIFLPTLFKNMEGGAVFAIVFFVADSNGGGGMTLTGPDSVIMENGIEGATITEYTFTVPPVDGHSGSDFGRVRGYNKLTGQWDQLDYGTTSNGITFTRTLGAGVYTQLEFYYYTNHDCMYNKSNITYSVSYHWSTD